MAKAHVSTLEGQYSDIVLGKVDSTDHGYNFKEVEMTWATTLVAGLVVKADGTPLATAADAADAYGVLVDRKVLPGYDKEKNGLVAGDKVPMVLAVRGLTLNFHKLVTADGVAITDAVAAQLEKNANSVTKRYAALKFSGQ